MNNLLLTLAATLALAGPAWAQSQTYAMTLGNRQLGTLTFDGQGQNVHLLSRLDNTPLGVADGVFEAVTKSTADGVAYLGRSTGNKSRDIAVTRTGSNVSEVTVTPSSEATDLSVVPAVPAGTLTPTEVFGRLANASSCPEPMTMYDGRRVVRMATTAMAQTGDSVTCDIAYNVVMGKGHLSPFGFKSLAMQAVYQANTLARITVSAGGFNVNLIRQ